MGPSRSPEPTVNFPGWRTMTVQSRGRKFASFRHCWTAGLVYLQTEAVVQTASAQVHLPLRLPLVFWAAQASTRVSRRAGIVLGLCKRRQPAPGMLHFNCFYWKKRLYDTKANLQAVTGQVR